MCLACRRCCCMPVSWHVGLHSTADAVPLTQAAGPSLTYGRVRRYVAYFKCNRQFIHQYPGLARHTRDIYHLPGARAAPTLPRSRASSDFAASHVMFAVMRRWRKRAQRSHEPRERGRYHSACDQASDQVHKSRDLGLRTQSAFSALQCLWSYHHWSWCTVCLSHGRDGAAPTCLHALCLNAWRWSGSARLWAGAGAGLWHEPLRACRAGLSRGERERVRRAGMAEAVDLYHIKTHYFTSHPKLNYYAIVPARSLAPSSLPAPLASAWRLRSRTACMSAIVLWMR